MEAVSYDYLDNVVNVWNLGRKLTRHPYLAYLNIKYVAPPLIKLNFFNRAELKFAFESIGQGLLSPQELKAMHYCLDALVESVGAALEAAAKNEPVVWYDYTVPSIILNAFGAAGICTSMVSKTPSYLGLDCLVDHFEAAENAGVSSEICSMTRLPLGAVLMNQMPKPAALLTTAQPCDSGRTVSQMLDYLADAPSFTIDSIYDKDEESIAHYSANLFDMIQFLQKVLNRKLDWDRLKMFVDELNMFNYYLREVSQMHRAIPSPGLGFIFLESSWPLRLFAAGYPSATKFGETIYEIGKRRITKDVEKRKKKEKIRVMISGAPTYFMDIYQWMQKEFDAYVVADYLVQTANPEIDTSTRESLIRGIAIDNLHLGMLRQSHGPVEFIIEDIENLIDEYSPDCLIFCGNIHCKHKKSVPKIIKDTCRTSGVPTLNMSLDLFDPRVNSEEAIKKQIKDFFINNGLA